MLSYDKQISRKVLLEWKESKRSDWEGRWELEAKIKGIILFGLSRYLPSSHSRCHRLSLVQMTSLGASLPIACREDPERSWSFGDFGAYGCIDHFLTWEWRVYFVPEVTKAPDDHLCLKNCRSEIIAYSIPIIKDASQESCICCLTRILLKSLTWRKLLQTVTS